MLKRIVFYILLAAEGLSGFAAGVAKGYVFDKNTGEPLPGASIYIHELERATVSDDRGMFVFEAIPTKNVRAEISFVGYETKIVSLLTNEILSIGLLTVLVEAPEVVVTASNFVSQHENAVKIEAISLAAIENIGTPSFLDATAILPGVDVISRGNGIGKPVIRGLSNSNLLVLSNGVKLENYQFSEDHPYVIDETGIDRIEVIKGPASLLYGSDAVGGLINVLSEHPAAVGETSGDVSVSVYSMSNGLTLNGGLKQSTQEVSWGLRGSLKSNRDYKDGVGRFVPNSRFGQQSVKTFLARNSELGFFKLSYDYSHLLAGMTNAASIGLVNSNKYEPDVWFQNLSNHVLLSKNTIYLRDTKVNANFSFNRNHRILNTTENNAVNMALNSFGGEVKTWLPTSKYYDLIVGIQSQLKSNANYDGLMRVLPDYNEQAYAFMGLFQYRLPDRLSLQVGARYDLNSLFIPEQRKAIHSHDEEPAHEDEVPGEAHEQVMHEENYVFHNASISVGATYEMNRNVLVRANVASAFRPPNVAELTQDGVHGNRYEKGDTSLLSQRNYEADLSIHYHYSSFSADVAAFYNFIPNYIYLSPTAMIYNELLVYQYQQNKARLLGGEVMFRFRPVSWIEMNGNLSVIRGMLNESSYLPFIPHDKINVGVKLMKEKYGFLKQAHFSANVRYAFAQNRPSQFETTTPQWTTVSVAAGAVIKLQNSEASVLLSLSNAFNEQYYDHLSTLKPLGYKNPGRNLGLRLNWMF
ncbi:MAG: TonB-dependent receptor [Prolixibacteraceae bacterium]|nr:TonB-dependent receptor [Prolixibacteraceae bacterium]MBN2650212.1 TonB-dependent receptor [Prolixibacteraceae bacterium]